MRSVKGIVRVVEDTATYTVEARRMRFFGMKDIDVLPQLRALPEDVRFAMKVVAHVFPFRVNNHVVEELVDWDAVPGDPIYQMTFPQPGMLSEEDFGRLADLIVMGASEEAIRRQVASIRLGLNPQPDGQLTANVPEMEGEAVPGIQHKYPPACLVFPSGGQTCHAYCTYCFRWAQFTGEPSLRFVTEESRRFETYIRNHREISDVVLTGGDPLIMSAQRLGRYVEPLLGPGFEHVTNIRIGTKVLGYWPHRFVGDPDADGLLRLFERVVESGKHLAIMAHVSHWRELGIPLAHDAIRRVRATGAEIRTQAPVMGHVNDSGDVWARMWAEQVNLGCIPYYMFVARETGAHDYFSVPLVRAFRVFSEAFREVSGLCRTVRGPVMSTIAGKVVVDGIEELWGRRSLVLRFIQARDQDWCLRPFLAAYDQEATWLSELKPADGTDEFFFEEPLRALLSSLPRRQLALST